MMGSPFSRTFLLMLFGPIVWAAHFFVIYGFTGLACARRLEQIEWRGIHVVTWVVGGSTVAAVVAILLIILRVKYKDAAHDNARFIRWMTASLGILSVVAIVWQSIPVLLVPICG